MSMLRIPLLLCFLLVADGEPDPKFPVGKETTYITGPLRPAAAIETSAAR
jgi:hypothetical protein